ncbi:branched-chain amino acid ABC transporter permease [Ferrovibrio sp.]|uniref:branched-chain amino acid ABC transporter permease n=1 Tax=Ferrovibrio sp. TaxID=1917215 RepID=UPI003D1456C6
MDNLYIFLEFSIIGLLAGGVLSLIGLSFVLVYKGTRAVNFAVGEIMILGAYLYYSANVWLGLHPVLALIVSGACIVLLTAVLERTVLRPLSGQPVVAMLMVTIGLASAMHGAVEMIWGGDTLTPPPLTPRTPLTTDAIFIPGAAIGNFLMAAAVIAAFLIFFRYSKTGVALRATASDQVTAATMGIDIYRTQRLTWALAGLVGAFAGILIATASGLSPLLASSALTVFAVIILGGLDSILGVIVASLIIAWLESLVAGYISGKARDIVPYAVVILVLIVRPYGLFGMREIERL